MKENGPTGCLSPPFRLLLSSFESEHKGTIINFLSAIILVPFSPYMVKLVLDLSNVLFKNVSVFFIVAMLFPKDW